MKTEITLITAYIMYAKLLGQSFINNVDEAIKIAKEFTVHTKDVDWTNINNCWESEIEVYVNKHYLNGKRIC